MLSQRLQSLAATLLPTARQNASQRGPYLHPESEQKGLTFDYLKFASGLIKTSAEIPAMCFIHQGLVPPLVNLALCWGILLPLRSANH